MKLPVFDGVQEALERRNVQRKRGLDRAKTTAVKKRRIELKRRRVVEGFQRSEWHMVVMHMVAMMKMNLTMVRHC